MQELLKLFVPAAQQLWQDRLEEALLRHPGVVTEDLSVQTIRI